MTSPRWTIEYERRGGVGVVVFLFDGERAFVWDVDGECNISGGRGKPIRRDQCPRAFSMVENLNSLGVVP